MHSQAVKCVKFLPANDGFITTSDDQTAILWKINKSSNPDKPDIKVKPLFRLKGHTESVQSADCSQNHIITGSTDKMIKIWTSNLNKKDDDFEEKKGTGSKGASRSPLMTISGHYEGITKVLFNEHDKIYSSSLDHTVRHWDIEIAKELDKISSAKAILDVSTSCENNILATSSTDRHIRIYDKKSLSLKSNLTFHKGWVSSISFNPNNNFQLLSTSYDKSAILWDVRSCNTPIYTINDHSDRVLCSDWGKFGILATGGVDCKMSTFETASV